MHCHIQVLALLFMYNTAATAPSSPQSTLHEILIDPVVGGSFNLAGGNIDTRRDPLAQEQLSGAVLIVSAGTAGMNDILYIDKVKSRGDKGHGIDAVGVNPTEDPKIKSRDLIDVAVVEINENPDELLVRGNTGQQIDDAGIANEDLRE